MNGREIFRKFGRYIYAIVYIEKAIPAKIRLKILSRIRNKDSKIAMLHRYIIVKSLAKNVGSNVSIFPNVYFENIENLSIGNNVSIHQMCYIDAEGGIEIGDNVSIAHRSTILSSNHAFRNVFIPIKYQKMNIEKTIIENDIWIGCGCVILAGVHIESGCVIGANSTVTHNITAFSIAVGSPAQVIKTRK